MAASPPAGNASREVVAGNRFHECLRRHGRRRLVTVRYLMYVLLPRLVRAGHSGLRDAPAHQVERPSGLGESGTHG
jgi:hypothetical protein